MNLHRLRAQLAQLRKAMPSSGRPMVRVFATKGPRPADAPADTTTCLRWYYADLSELGELRAKFDREFGPEAREPNDVPCVFFRMISQQEIFAEQYKGTKYEHLWMGGPTVEAVQ